MARILTESFSGCLNSVGHAMLRICKKQLAWHS